MVVWTTSNYIGALGQEEHFSWLETDSAGSVTKVYLKSKPQTTTAKLIVGNFSFKDTYLAMQFTQLIGLGICKSNSEVKEQHLELLISEMLDAGLSVGTIDLEWFAAIGTEMEFMIADYFEKALSEISAADV